MTLCVYYFSKRVVEVKCELDINLSAPPIQYFIH